MLERFINKYVTGGLLIALGISILGWYVTDAKLDACKSGRKQDKALYEKAQSDALAEHLKAIRAKEKEYADKSKKADEAYDALVSKYNGALRLYVDAQSKARRAATASEGGSTPSVDRPGENPFISPTDITYPELDITQVVVVPVADLETCAINTARLVSARNWALGLNE